MDRIALGMRIKKAREGLKPKLSAEQLAAALKSKFPKTTATRQLVNQWEAGLHPPPWNKIEQLAVVLGVEEDWLVFGDSHRVGDSRFLAYITSEEMALLTSFRKTNQLGQKTLLPMAETIANQHPAPEAEILHIKRK